MEIPKSNRPPSPIRRKKKPGASASSSSVLLSASASGNERPHLSSNSQHDEDDLLLASYTSNVAMPLGRRTSNNNKQRARAGSSGFGETSINSNSLTSSGPLGMMTASLMLQQQQQQSSTRGKTLDQELEMIPSSEELETHFMKLFGRLRDDKTMSEWLGLGQESTIGEDLGTEEVNQTQRERDFIRAFEKLIGDENMKELAVNYDDGFLLDDIQEDRLRRAKEAQKRRREEKLRALLQNTSRLARAGSGVYSNVGDEGEEEEGGDDHDNHEGPTSSRHKPSPLVQEDSDLNEALSLILQISEFGNTTKPNNKKSFKNNSSRSRRKRKSMMAQDEDGTLIIDEDSASYYSSDDYFDNDDNDPTNYDENDNDFDENNNTKNTADLSEIHFRKPATAETSWEAELALRRAALESGVGSDHKSALNRFLITSRGHRIIDGVQENYSNENEISSQSQQQNHHTSRSGIEENNKNKQQQHSLAGSRASTPIVTTASHSPCSSPLLKAKKDEDIGDFMKRQEEYELAVQRNEKKRLKRLEMEDEDYALGKASGEPVWIPPEPHYYVDLGKRESDEDEEEEDDGDEDEDTSIDPSSSKSSFKLDPAPSSRASSSTQQQQQHHDKTNRRRNTLTPQESPSSQHVNNTKSPSQEYDKSKKRSSFQIPQSVIRKIQDILEPSPLNNAKVSSPSPPSTSPPVSPKAKSDLFNKDEDTTPSALSDPFLNLLRKFAGATAGQNYSSSSTNPLKSRKKTDDKFINQIRLLLSQARELFVDAADFAFDIEQDFWEEINRENFLATGRKKNIPVKRIKKETIRISRRKSDYPLSNSSFASNTSGGALPSSPNAPASSLGERRRSSTLFHTGNLGSQGKSILFSTKNTSSPSSPVQQQQQHHHHQHSPHPPPSFPAPPARRASSIRFVSGSGGGVNSEGGNKSKSSSPIGSPNQNKSHLTDSIDWVAEEDDFEQDGGGDSSSSPNPLYFSKENLTSLTPGDGPSEGSLSRIRTFVERGLFQLDEILSRELPEAKFEEFPDFSTAGGSSRSGYRRNLQRAHSGGQLVDNDDDDDDEDDEDDIYSASVRMKRDVKHLFGSHKNLGSAVLLQEKEQRAKEGKLNNSTTSENNDDNNNDDSSSVMTPSPPNTATGADEGRSGDANETSINKDRQTTMKRRKNSMASLKNTKPLPPGVSDNTYLMSAAAILGDSSSPTSGGSRSGGSGSDSSSVEDRRYSVVLNLIATILDSLLYSSDSNNDILQQAALELEVIMGEMRELKAENLEHVLARDQALGEITFALEEIQTVFRLAARVAVHIQDEGVFRGIVKTFVAASRRMQDFAREIARIGEVALLDAKDLRARLAKAKPEHESMIVALLELADAIETQPVAVPRHAQWRRRALDELYWNLQSAISTLSTLELAADPVAEEIVSAPQTNAVALHIRKLMTHPEGRIPMEQLSEMYLKDMNGNGIRSVMKGTALAIAARRRLREMGRAMDNEWGFSCW